jgi:hypothetical protein
MYASVLKPWDTRHRLAAALSCVIIAIVTVLCGICQQFTEEAAKDFRIPEMVPAGILGKIGIGTLAPYLLAFFVANAILFLLANCRRATIITIVFFVTSLYILHQVLRA